MDTVIINDTVWGHHSVTEPVLVSLLSSKAVLRLKGIHQAGASYMVRRGRDNLRYDHVVGTMLLIRLLRGTLLEQIAGLIHDVSHTAFSHVIDQVYGIQGEDYHEFILEELVLGSDIPAILDMHGYRIQDVLESERWTLLDRPSPDLCADRIDYTLRDLLRIGLIDTLQISTFIKSLRDHNGQIVCTDPDAALWFTRFYTTEVCDLFMNPVELYANEQLANAIREGLNKGILSISDLMLQDDDVLSILYNSNDTVIMGYLNRISPTAVVLEDRINFEVCSHPKARIIDPLVQVRDGMYTRCSSLYPEVTRMHEIVRHRAESGIYVRAIIDDQSGSIPNGP